MFKAKYVGAQPVENQPEYCNYAFEIKYMFIFKTFEISVYGPANLFDITEHIRQAIKESSASNGLALILSIGSTGALFKLPHSSYEDFISWVLKRIPYKSVHRHPGNAFAHLRSAVVGCDLILPIREGQMLIGEKSIALLENTAGRKKRRFSLILVGED